MQLQIWYAIVQYRHSHDWLKSLLRPYNIQHPIFVMQTHQTSKQEISLIGLEELLLKYFQHDQQQTQQTNQSSLQKSIDETVKKLQSCLSILYADRSPDQSKEGEGINTRENDHQVLYRIIDILVQQIGKTDSTVCFDWLMNLVKVQNICSNTKTESIYDIAKQVSDSTVIALPYDAGQTGPLIVSNVSDGAQQASSVSAQYYFKEDEAMFSVYLNRLFEVIKRESISEFSTKIVQHLCKSLVAEFVAPNSQHCLESHIKFLELLDSISGPIYTYYLIFCFKAELDRLSACINLTKQTKCSKSISSEKINRLIYCLTSISGRWEGTVYYSKAWQWDIKSKLILALLSSNVSQTKLTAVKMLVQFCKKVSYSAYQPQQIQAYIRENNILGEVFAIDNHPEIINKGKDIYQFLCKFDVIQESEIDVLLDLALKSNQNVRKSVYAIIQSLGQTNLTQYCRKILSCIRDLPRAIFYTEETLDLLETLLVLSPVSQIQQNMSIVYTIIRNHYEKLRKNLRERLIRLYFEIFIMGVEEGVFDQADGNHEIVRNIGENLGTNMSAYMLESLIRVIKNQGGKQIGEKCKKILQQSIEWLFKKYKIHEVVVKCLPQPGQSQKITRSNYKELLSSNPNFYSQHLHFELVKYLLECYEGSQIPISYEELCFLIDADISFTKFIQYYQEQQQIQVIDSLLSQPNKDPEHVSNIVQIFSLVSGQVKSEVISKAEDWLIKSNDFEQKSKLGEFLANNAPLEPKFMEVLAKLEEENCDNMAVLGYLILIKNLLARADRKGFGKHLPFTYSSNSYRVKIKVTNSIDILKPFMYELESQSYQTLSQLISSILLHDNLKISCVNFKINDKYMSISDLQLRVGEIAKNPTYPHDNAHGRNGEGSDKEICVIVFDVYESEWFDKSQLITQGVLNYEVVIALSEIFTKFTTAGRMHRKDCARLFELATDTDHITEQDSRIEHLFSHYSQNGEYLALDQCLNFYQKSSEDNPALVINNLKKLGYAHLFKDEKDILSEYSTNHDNMVRNFVVEKGHFLYSILSKNYEPKINRLCRELLWTLPIEPELLISRITMEDKQEEKKRKGQVRPQINYGVLEKKLLNSGISQRQYLLYLLALLEQNKQIFTETPQSGKEEGNEQWKFQIQRKLVQLLEIIVRLPELNDDTNDVQDILIESFAILARIVKCFCFNRVKSPIPPTLIDSIRPKPTLQTCSLIEDPLQKQRWTIQKQLPRPSIKVSSIYPLAEKLLTNRFSGIAMKTRQTLVEQLLFICLLDPELGSGQVQISHPMIFHPLREVRSIFNNFYFLVCELDPSVKSQYYSVDLDQLEGQLGNEACFDEFFATFNQMLRLETDESEGLIYSKVSQKIETSIRELAGKQNQRTGKLVALGQHSAPESLLLGRLTILDSIKLYKPDIRMESPHEWLTKLLSQPHRNETRSILYRMSQSLCPLSYNLETLWETMKKLSIYKNSKLRKHEHMGLYNLGCICYINATIQQLFMIEPFKNAILAVDAGEEKDGYFWEFQYMIYQLMYGNREFFIPDSFCLAYTDFEGKPIDIKQQHDADEFLNSLLDRLEQSLTSNPSVKPQLKQTIRGNFCGEVGSMITCQSCFESKVKVEDFYILSLEIKHNKNIMECFEKLTEPESISDYFCDKCQKKQLITKQLKIRKLPSFLFIHLQRLVFDLQSLSKIKLEHLVDYPEILDLSQFYASGQDQQVQDCPKYRLKGMVVHVGTSESGHYYSIIREATKWVKFDDSRVDDWNDTQYAREKEGTYLIIYERIDEEPKHNNLPIVVGNKELFNRTSQDNKDLIREEIFLQKSFSKHLTHTLSQLPLPMGFLSSPQSTAYYPNYAQYLTAEHEAMYRKVLEVILLYLKLIVEAKSILNWEVDPIDAKTVACYCGVVLYMWPQGVWVVVQWLLGNGDNGKINTDYFRMIIANGEKIIRQAYKLIFIKVISILHSFSDEIFDNYLLPIQRDMHPSYWYTQKCLQYLMSALHDAAKHPTKLDEYLEILYLVARISPKMTEYLVKNSLGPKLIHFICGDETGMRHRLQPYNYQVSVNSNSKKNEVMASISQLLFHLIQAHVSDLQNKEMDDLQRQAYYGTNWYGRMYQARIEYGALGQSLGLLAPHDPILQQKLCRMVIENVNRFNHADEYIVAYIHLCSKLLTSSSASVAYLLGIPALASPLSNPQAYSQVPSRQFKYEIADITPKDEHLMPVLELLLTNRHQANCFTLATANMLLNCMLSTGRVWDYLARLPAPPPCRYYTDCISVLLKQALKETKVETWWKHCINQIAALLNEVENKLQDQMGKEESQQELIIKENEYNQLYKLNGPLKQTQVIALEVQGQYTGMATVFEDQAGTRIITYQLLFVKNVDKCKIKFLAGNYEYEFQSTIGEICITTPYPNSPLKPYEAFEAIHQVSQYSTVPTATTVPQNQIQSDGEAAKQKIEESSHTVVNTKMQAQNEQIFECPFCTSISFTWTSRCPVCGQEWGEMA